MLLGWLGVIIAPLLSNPLRSYPGRDGGIFLYIGSLILNGGIPYADVWENKGPLVFYINAAGLWIAEGSRWGVWFMELLALLAAAWLGIGTIRRTLGLVPALLGTFLWLHATGGVLQGGNFSEEFSLPFAFLAVAVYVRSLVQPGARRYPVLLGSAMALAVLLRPNLISIQAAAILAYCVLAVRSAEWWLLARRLGWAALGFAAVIVPVVLYFAAHRALDDMIQIALLFNLQYSQGGGVAKILNGFWEAAAALGPLPIVMALAGYGASAWLTWRRAAPDDAARGLLLLSLVGWPIEIVLSTLSGRNYLHYFISWAPYVGLLTAAASMMALGSFAPRLERRALVVMLLLMLPSLARASAWRDYGTVVARAWSGAPEPTEYRDSVASYIMANTSPGETVFVWGFRPIVNFVADRAAPVSFLPYPLIHVDTPLGQGWADQFYRQFTANPPSLVVNLIEDADSERIPDLDPAVRQRQTLDRRQVVLAGNLKETLRFLEEYYLLEATVDGHGIYRLSRKAQ